MGIVDGFEIISDENLMLKGQIKDLERELASYRKKLDVYKAEISCTAQDLWIMLETYSMCAEQRQGMKTILGRLTVKQAKKKRGFTKELAQSFWSNTSTETKGKQENGMIEDE